MADRYYIAPPDDPNGNAGKVVRTDDQGNFDVIGFPSQAPGQPAYPGGPVNAPAGGAAAPGTGGVYPTREGPRSIADIRAGIIAAGGTPTGDDAQDVAMFNGAGGGGASVPGGVDPSGFVNLGLADLTGRMALGQGQLALEIRKLQELGIPGLALQRATFEAQRDYQLKQLEQQGSQFGQDLALRQQQFGQDLALRQQQLGLQGVLGRGDLALRGLGQASQEDLQRQQLGLAAAGQASDEALRRAQLAASLRGPSNAFQQMNVLYGMGPNGVSNLARVLTGQSAAPAFQAPQAPAEGASLQTLARDAADAVGYRIGGTASQGFAAPSSSDIAMGIAARNAGGAQGSPTYNAALGMALPNAQFAIPGSAVSQIPGLGGRVNAAIQQLRTSNYGLTDAGTINSAMAALRNDPAYQQADGATRRQMEAGAIAQKTGLSAGAAAGVIDQLRAYSAANGGAPSPDNLVTSTVVDAAMGDLRNSPLYQQADGATRRTLEAQALGRATGLPPQLAGAAIEQMLAGSAASGQPSTPDQIAQAIQSQVGEYRRQQEAATIAQTTGLSPTAARGVVEQLRAGSAGSGQMFGDQDLERVLAGALGVQGGTAVGGGFGGGAPTYSAQPVLGGPPTYSAPTGGTSSFQPVAMRPLGGTTFGFLQSGQQQVGGARVNEMGGAGGAMGFQSVGTRTAMGAPVNPGGSQAAGGYSAPLGGGQPRQPGLTQQANAFLDAMPAPNQLNARNFFAAPKSAQDLTLSAFEQKGYDPNDVLTTLKNTLPQATAGSRAYGAVA